MRDISLHFWLIRNNFITLLKGLDLPHLADAFWSTCNRAGVLSTLAWTASAFSTMCFVISSPALLARSPWRQYKSAICWLLSLPVFFSCFALKDTNS